MNGHCIGAAMISFYLFMSLGPSTNMQRLFFFGRKSNEDLALLSIILNQEVRRLSTQVITTPGIRIDQWKSMK